MRSALLATWLAAFVAAGPVMAANTGEMTPKRGGTLTYMIPADAPPSLDGHREETFAMLHAVAPFYSVLMRVDPENPVGSHPFRLRSLHRDSEIATDDEKTYSFKIRTDVKFPRRFAADRRRCGGKLRSTCRALHSVPIPTTSSSVPDPHNGAKADRTGPATCR